MKKTWRWLGKKDKVTLPMLRKIGIEGIVTALHDIPDGEIWTLEAILDLRDYIENEGLEWSVVECLPVSELIKCGRADNRLIDNYILSLANLGTAEIKTVCYNFTPATNRLHPEICKVDAAPSKKLLSLYNGIDKSALRENMKYFINQMMPVCEEFCINMCVYPDSFPSKEFGLPHIVTKSEDLEWILKTVYNPYNGLAFCTESLNQSQHNNMQELAKKFAANTHFVCLKSMYTQIINGIINTFYFEENKPLKEMVNTFEKYNPSLPICIGHGKISD